MGVVFRDVFSDVRADVYDYDVPLVVYVLLHDVSYDVSDEVIRVVVIHDDGQYDDSNGAVNDVANGEDGDFNGSVNGYDAANSNLERK